MKRYLLIIILGLAGLRGAGQINFAKSISYPGPSPYMQEGERLFLAHQNSDGGYILAGSDSGYFAGVLNNIMVVRTDSYGDTVWMKTYGGIQNEIISSIYQTSDGGFISGEVQIVSEQVDTIYMQ